VVGAAGAGVTDEMWHMIYLLHVDFFDENPGILFAYASPLFLTVYRKQFVLSGTVHVDLPIIDHNPFCVC
jgi:hypothetical protein